MASLKSLAKDTAIYGLSSIVGRFLNYLLVPLYTARLSAESGGYGVITNVYAYTALILVILTYGMETTLFRYSNKDGENADTVFSTALKSVSVTSLMFIVLVLAFISPLSVAMGYGSHPAYIWTMAVTVAVDAVHCILFARLRYEKRPVKFAALKLLFIILNIVLNILFFVVLPDFAGCPVDVGYAFYINLACSMIVTLCFIKEIKTAFGVSFDRALLRRMLSYSWPILILGIAGILNQAADKILFPYLYDGPNAHGELGIYGAASKIAMIMAMITQAFRYAYEPFVFGKAKDRDSRETYAKAMKYFIIFTLMAFLIVTGYLGLLKYIIGRDYWSGLRVVPIVMAAEIMMGVYFNLSFWYKLTDRTIWGAWFSGIGCAVLITVNVLFVPRYGYMACAWAGVAGYGTAMTLSYIAGRRYYPIDYPLGRIAAYVLLAAVLFYGMTVANAGLALWAALAVNTVLVAVFAGVVVKMERPHPASPRGGEGEK
ncbi:MAG: lipopolysaccharide biosynthesis protein [Prevotella sp.]|nr:lipopolysaccharide biosynthesis protein [Prevotella sp.]